MDLRADELALFVTENFWLDKTVDVIAITAVRGHAACRSVRLVEVPLVLKRGHLRAHGRRAHAEIVLLSKGRRADGFAGRDIFIHHRAENRRLAPVQLGLRRWRGWSSLFIVFGHI